MMLNSEQCGDTHNQPSIEPKKTAIQEKFIQRQEGRKITDDTMADLKILIYTSKDSNDIIKARIFLK